MILRDFFISMLLITGIIIGGRLLFHDVSDIYGVSRSENFTAFDDYINETYTQISDIETSIQGSKVQETGEVDSYSFLKGVFGTMKLTLKLPSLYSGLVTESIKLLKLNSAGLNWVYFVVVGMISITILFIILSAALKYKV